MRKALIIGIDQYSSIDSLSGCVKDANAVVKVLERNADNSTNFQTPRLILGSKETPIVKKSILKAAVRELFQGECEIALLYFAGHGYVEDTGGYLCAGDCETGDDGLSLHEVMTFANRSKAKNRVIILDSCHSGVIGSNPIDTSLTELKEGTTILTASTEDQYAMENGDASGGVFTTLLVDALEGAAANLVGDVTPGSIYAHIDQSLGPWAQRPVFKTNVQTFVSLRKAKPAITLSDLQALITYFPSADYKFPLDPSFEPERFEEHKLDPNILPPDPVNTQIFACLQRYVKVNLLRPIGAAHMWHAAMNSKSCELTVLGQHYWKLVKNRLI
ncbi:MULTISPECIES: caspase family protein [Acinetobacter]|jgi:hypothetical protein|uniref:caspase family protein n=1 Tax=Acinetobacter TaxID=469 RepID=UPI00287BD72E|nr:MULTISPECIES: caspase family protein [Acinetobacter]MDS7924566.1 caspase family protein [Acinetobacter sp. V115_6]WQF72734.1 caspase family protein [Acinetobacter oleivorans]